MKSDVKGCQKETRTALWRDPSLNGVQETFHCFKAATNMKTRKKGFFTNDELCRTNEFDLFFLIIEMHDASSECKTWCRILSTWKSVGPDGVSSYNMETFAWELTAALCSISQKSLDSHRIPSLWKQSTIIPICKISYPKDDNDFRPVALTFVLLRCFENYMVSLLKSEMHS